MQVLARSGAVALLTVLALTVSGCAQDVAATSTTTSDESAVSETSTTAVTTTAETTTTTIEETTTTLSAEEVQFEEDADLIMALYEGWNAAIDVGQDEIDGYANSHLYPDLPQCASGEKDFPKYTALRETIAASDDWTISWGPLNGTTPDGRVYEVQLEGLDSPSHVSVLHGVAYVFWNCKGYVGSGYEVGDPTYEPKSQAGSGGAAGSGCSPGSGSLPDGVWFGEVAEYSDTSITFDLACMWPDKEEGDGYIVNESDKLRTLPVASDARVHRRTDEGWEEVAVEVWADEPVVGPLCLVFEECSYFWLYVNGGSVTEAVQLWFS